MALYINSNIISSHAQFNLPKTTSSLANTMARLPTLSRGNDAAASIAISSQQSSLRESLSAAQSNTQNEINKANVMDGALSSTTDMLQRLVMLAHQASNGTVNANQRATIGVEFAKVKSAIEFMSKNTKFNGENLLSSSAATTGAKTYTTSEAGAAKAATAQLDTSKTTLYSSSNAEDGILTRSYGGYHLASSDNTPASSKEMKITAETTTEEAADMVVALKGMIDGVNSARTEVGAFQSELNYDMQSQNLKINQLSQSGSRYVDTDMDINAAREAANLSLAQIRQQASVTLLSRTNENAVFLRDLLR